MELEYQTYFEPLEFRIQAQDDVKATFAFNAFNVDDDINKLNSDLLTELGQLPLLKSVDKQISIQDVINVNYNSDALLEDLSEEAKSTFLNDHIVTLKNNSRRLYDLMGNQAFQDVMENYLQTKEHTLFKLFVAIRHVVAKVATLLFICFTVAEHANCMKKKVKLENAQKQKSDAEREFNEAKQEYDSLLQLLKDTTNILLNIDAVKSMKTNANIPPNAVNGAQAGGKIRYRRRT